jgi:hypothetical protein
MDHPIGKGYAKQETDEVETALVPWQAASGVVASLVLHRQGRFENANRNASARKGCLVPVPKWRLVIVIGAG